MKHTHNFDKSLKCQVKSVKYLQNRDKATIHTDVSIVSNCRQLLEEIPVCLPLRSCQPELPAFCRCPHISFFVAGHSALCPSETDPAHMLAAP